MSSRAYLHLRHGVPKRRAAFVAGLQRLGCTVCHELPTEVEAGAVFVTWNRIGAGETWARAFEKQGNKVIVAENASWGNDFLGRHWYHIAANVHNTAGKFPLGGPERWDCLGVALPPFRVASGKPVILPQRGIGSPPTRMPANFPRQMMKRYDALLRPHPGRRDGKPLEKDLVDCSRVITWGSGAAIKALMMGIPVESHMPKWIGRQKNTEESRLRMFQKLAWAQWELDEIASGEPFARLLR